MIAAEAPAPKHHKVLKVGDKIPLFTLPDGTGKPVSIKDHLGKKTLVIYFYPKDESPGCTAEACSFRDSYLDFTNEGAEVIGISSDDSASHRKFAEHHQLPFTLLADESGKVRKEFGVPRAVMGLIPGRVTYIVDKFGIIRYTFTGLLNGAKHSAEALAAVKKLSEK